MKKYLLLTTMAFSLYCFAGNDNKGRIIISGNYSSAATSDTVTLYVWDHFFSENKKMVTPHRTYHHMMESANFKFRIDSIQGPVYISLVIQGKLRKKPEEMLNLYLCEPGDSINLQLIGKQLLFSGKGAAKYACRYLLDSVTVKINDYFLADHAKFTEVTNRNYRNFGRISYQEQDSLLFTQRQLLSGLRPLVTEEVFNIMEADLIGKNIQSKYSSYKFCCSRLDVDIKTRGEGESDRDSYLALYQDFMQSAKLAIPRASDIELSYAREYIKAQIQLAIARQKKEPSTPVDVTLRRHDKGPLLDKLLATYLIENFDFIPAADSVLELALIDIQSPYCKEPLIAIQNRMAKGAEAYNFVLINTSGKYIRLHDYLGKTVFLDLWFTGCTGCVLFYRNTLRDIEKLYEKDTSFVFISISIDTDKDKWLASIKSGNYTSEKAINLSTGELGGSHPVINRYGTTGYPSLAVINKAGKIVSRSSLMVNKDLLIKTLLKANEE